jgi:hypothetical protein
MLVCLILMGCNKSAKDELTSKKTTKITILCKGQKYYTSRSEKGETKHQSTVTTSYIFTVSDSSLTIDTNGSSSISPLNYEYLDQKGKPKAMSNWTVNEQKIHFEQYYWDHFDDQHDKETSSNNDISINRISGEWLERRNSSIKYKNQSWTYDYWMDIGTCENANQKF